MINTISDREHSLNQNPVETSSTESDLLVEQEGIKHIQSEKEKQKSQDLSHASDLRSQLQDTPNPEQMKEMTKFYENLDRKLFEIEYTCGPEYDKIPSNASRKEEYLQKRMESLIELFETKSDGNFLLKSNQKLAESIGLKNEIRGTFNYSLMHLVDLYNDDSLVKGKLYQMGSTVVFLRSLLSRHIQL